MRCRLLSLCTLLPSHSQWPSEHIRQCACPFCSSHVSVFGKASHHPSLSDPLHSRFGSLRLPAFPIAKIAFERYDKTVTQYTSSVSGVSLPTDEPHSSVTIHECAVRSLLAAKLHQGHATVLEIFTMDWYFPDSPHTHCPSWSWMTFKNKIINCLN